MLPIATILWQQNWIKMETESLNWIFQIYGYDAEKPHPSLYTKYGDLAINCIILYQSVTGIRESVDALCGDGAGEISRDCLQRGHLTRQGTTS